VRNREFDIDGSDVPRELFPRGRIRLSLGTSKKGESSRRRQCLEQLRALEAWDIIKAMVGREIHISDVARRMRQKGEAAIPELRAELKSRDVPVPTFEQAVWDYLDWYETVRREHSVAQIRSRLKRLGEQPVSEEEEDVARPAAPAVRLRDLKITEIRRRDIARAMSLVSTSKATQEALRLAASGLFSWLILEEWEEARRENRAARWTANPAKRVERRERRPRSVTASQDQIEALFAAAEPHQRAYLRALVSLGLRRGELIHTRYHLDLNLDTWEWQITDHPPDRRCGCPQCRGTGWSPKTREGHRTLSVPAAPPVIRQTFRDYEELWTRHPGDYFFQQPAGGMWSAETLRADFRSLCDRAQVRYGRSEPGGLTLHTLRHTLATNLVRAEVRESVGAAIMGITVGTFVKNYVHLDPSDLAAGISRAPSYDTSFPEGNG